MSEYDHDVPIEDDDTEMDPNFVGLQAAGTFESDYVLSDDETRSIWDMLYEVVQKPENRPSLTPIQCTDKVPKTDLGLKLTKDVWDKLPDGLLYPGWAPWMEAWTVGQVSRVAGTMLTATVYSSQGDDAANAYNGYGHYVLGEWQPIKGAKYKYLIDVQPALAATAQMVAAGVALSSTSTYAKLEGQEKKQLVTTRCYEYTHDDTNHPLALKRALRNYVVLPKGVTAWRDSYAKVCPFVWESVARAVSLMPVISANMTPVNCYYYFVNTTVALPKSRLLVTALLTLEPLKYSLYRHMISNSWYSGGIMVKHMWFMAWAQKKYFPDLAWSGEFGIRLPNWCMVEGGKFEKSGASTGDGHLRLRVTGVVDPAEMTGIIWAPKGTVRYPKAAGMAIPLSDDAKCMAPAWNHFGLKGFHVVAVVGATPFILCIKEGACEVKLPLNDINNTALIFDKAASIGVYNFVTNIQRTNDSGYPERPIIAYTVDRKLEYEFLHQNDPIIPGRFCPVDVSTKVKDAAELFAGYANAGLGGQKSGRPGAGDSGEHPSKYTKTGEF